MNHPKHVLPLFGGRTLFQLTLDRLEGFIPIDHVYVVTIANQVKDLKLQAPNIPIENILIEPMPRSTASAVGLTATVLSKRDSEALMLVLPSDHFILDVNLFHNLMRVAIDAARKDYLVTLGITPTFPATGYGYIQHGVLLEEKYDLPIYQVLHFIEKPDEARAQILLAEGFHSWNSGVFIWTTNRILREFTGQMPHLKQCLGSIGSVWGTKGQEELFKSSWSDLKTETIDYGIMEHATNVAVLPADSLGWSDVGAWDSMFDVIQADQNGKVTINSDHISFETYKSLIYSSKNKLIVDSGDALLVCRRDQARQVRKVILNLKNTHQEEYL